MMKILLLTLGVHLVISQQEVSNKDSVHGSWNSQLLTSTIQSNPTQLQSQTTDHQNNNYQTTHQILSSKESPYFEIRQLESDSVPDTTFSKYTSYGGSNNGWTNPSWTGQTSSSFGGTISCTVCSAYDALTAQRCCAFGYRQCCTVADNSWGSWNTNRPLDGNDYTYNTYNYDKPGNCYYQGYGHSSRGGLGNVNFNSGYYYTRRSDVGVNADGHQKTKRDAPVSQTNHYAVSSDFGSGYNGGGYYSGNSHSTGGRTYSGGYHDANRPVYPSSNGRYCRRDYECPGIQKCCAGTCSYPAASVG